MAQEESTTAEADPLVADQVYVIMSSSYRISRNRRAEWYLNFIFDESIVTLAQKKSLDEFTEELEILSVIPENPPSDWSPETSHLYRYRILSRTIVNFLSRKYKLAYCLDISPSVASVDVQAGIVMFEGIYDALKISMEGLVRPFHVPGSLIVFQPIVYITVIAHTPFLASLTEQILIQGILLSPSTITTVLSIVFERLTKLETKVAEVTASISEAVENAQAKSDRIVGQLFDEEGGNTSSQKDYPIAMSPDFGFVDLLRQALIGLHLLPENSSAGLIIVTDGVISVPDGGYLDTILSQLRYNTVSCSFIQLSSPFHPHLCYGVLPYADLLRFISTATFGVFLTSVPEINYDDCLDMNIYHQAFLVWSFQKALEGFKLNPLLPPTNRPGEWSVRNKCFFSVRDMPIVKKQQYETTLQVDYMKVLSCRLREGFTIKEVNISQDNVAEIKLVLSWKFLIQIFYVLTTTLPASSPPKVNCAVSLEGPYDFLHDVTCLAKKPFQSYYRQLMVSRFWQSQKNLSESDKLLVHFNSFVINPASYNIPDSLRNGVPLFYISSSNSAPVLLSSDFDRSQNQFAQFAQFWKPVCLLDTTIWQKWMHTYACPIILEHDHPLPKNLHLANQSGRYHVIQCRQSYMALNTLLKDWSSFVLIENHSYIKLIFNDHDKPPSSFYIIRVTSKPPCVVLRLAFLVGTPGQLRHEALTTLRQKVSTLTFPQRLKELEPSKWRSLSPNPTVTEENEVNISKPITKSWVLHCCTLLHKPIEKILLRYERVPRNVFKALLPQNSYNNISSPKAAGSQSTFGFRPTFHTPWGSSNKMGQRLEAHSYFMPEELEMGPEMFNTVARYLFHQRWIWCIQSSKESQQNTSCAAQILSTLTKMRLQEGFRFAHSGAGILNMTNELFMTTEIDQGHSIENGSDNLEEEEDNTTLTPCVLQYIMFPPVSASGSQLDDDDEGEAESADGADELYLVTECWIEPQFGKIVDNKKSYMDGLEYSEIPQKIFEIDRECISALVAFEHLSLMCRNEERRMHDERIPPSPDMQTSTTQSPKPVIANDDIKLIPFALELNRIIPKSQQAEILFSMFSQDLSMSFPVNASNEFSNFCDQANCVLYDAWSLNVSKLHDREVSLLDEDFEAILKMILERRRPDVYKVPIVFASKQTGHSKTALPRWRCFIKGINPTHIILTLLPASYHDVKLLVLSQDCLDEVAAHEGEPSRSVYMLSETKLEVRDNEDLPSILSEKSDGGLEESTQWAATTSTPIRHFKEGSKMVAPEVRPPTGLSSITGRKRSRVKSGGESGGPLAKRPLNRKNSIDNSFRFRAGSMDNYWRSKNIHRSRTKSADDKNYGEISIVNAMCMEHRKPPGFNDDSSCPSSCSNKINESPSQETKRFHGNQPKYGSITLPVYSYDFSLTQLTEHVIRRTFSGKHDLYLDFRVATHSSSFKSKGSENDDNSKEKHVASPKSDDGEFIPISLQVLREHCERLEMAFTKSYIHGLFESLQKKCYIHRTDIDVAIGMCQRSTLEIDLNEFVATICSHFKEAKQKQELSSSEVKGSNPAETEVKCDHPKQSFFSMDPCDDMASVHAFIRKRFQNILLSTFNWVTDYSDIFYFKLDRLDAENIMSAPDSSKNTSDFDEVESMTVKAESACSDLLRVPSVNEDLSKSPDYGSSDPLLSQEFIVQTMEDGCEVRQSDLSSPVPLFMYLTCSFKYDDFSGVFGIRDIPTCAEEVLGEVEEVVTTEEFNLNNLGLVMQFVFLTVSSEIDEIDRSIGALQTNTRTYSVSSASSLPNSQEEVPPEIVMQENNASVVSEPEKVPKKYPDLPLEQLQAVKRTVEDVKWLLKDEITSFCWETGPLSEDILNLVSNHVQKSIGKPGCQLHIMPLTFVNNAYSLGFEKFKERFKNLTVDGYRLAVEGSWFYLVAPSRNSRVNSNNVTAAPESSNNFSNEYGDQQDESSSKELVTGEMMRESLKLLVVHRGDSDVEDAEIAQIADRTNNSSGASKPPPLRKLSGLDNNAQCKTASLENIQCYTYGKQQDTASDSQGHRLILTTPSQMSEISSVLGSAITNEDGYDGDGSESGDDGAPSEAEGRALKLPPFWMIFKLHAEQIVMYFHCRYNEDDLSVFEFSNQLLQKILKINLKLRRIVNQDLLLQQLHDTRQCSPLLEPENDDAEMWEGREATVVALPAPVTAIQSVITDSEFESVSQLAESMIDFTHGTYSCDIVWETKFYLHSRLRTGPGKSVLSRGIQTLETTLIAFEVTNRRNMFVYRDTSGNVFYLRLYRMPTHDQGVAASPNLSENSRPESQLESQSGKNRLDYDDNFQDNRFNYLNAKDAPSVDIHSGRSNSEDVVLLQVHGIKDAGSEIKEQLVQSLSNKLDDSVLDILSVTLDRNPHCKLNPEDVHFIQKPFSQPDTILRYDVQKYAAQYLPAFLYYLHQNLLQFLHVPKYTDNKVENHFQDYSRLGEEWTESNESTMYLYNQSPGGTGSRGIACISIALMDTHENIIKVQESCRPSSQAYLKAFSLDEFVQLTNIVEISEGDGNLDIVLEFHVWKQGRINMDLLKTFASTAIKHSMWDLAMEFYFLTAPLTKTPIDAVSTASEPTTPKSSLTAFSRCAHKAITRTPGKSHRVVNELSVKFKKIDMVVQTSSKPGEIKEGMTSVSGITTTTSTVDSKEFMRLLERRNSANLPPFVPERSDVDTSRARSMSFSARKPVANLDGRAFLGRAPSPLTLTQGLKSKYNVDPAVLGLTRYDSGECGELHSAYGENLKAWCNVGNSLSVPSLRIVPIKFLCRHDVDVVAQEVEKIIQSVAQDNIPRQFWKVQSSSSYMAGNLRSNSMEKLESNSVYDAEFKTFTNGLTKLKDLEKLEETEYPADLLNLFKTPEDFSPSGLPGASSAVGHECVIISRLAHWKACTSQELFIDLHCNEAQKNTYKFQPLIAGNVDTGISCGGPPSSSASLDKIPSSISGLAPLASETDTITHPILIPRQRLLVASINNSQILYCFYNWSKEASDRLIEQTKCLALWVNARTALLSSILAQKSGLFAHQPILHSTPLPSLCAEGNPFTGVDVDVLIKNHAPPKEYSSGRLSSIKKNKSPKVLAPFLECYRNVKHASMLKHPEPNVNLLKSQGDQLLQNRVMDKKDSQKLFQYWLVRGPSASNMITYDAIQSFKRASRSFIHYCMTPIIFLPRWRIEVAATRDSSIGTMKKPRVPTEGKRVQWKLQDTRSRHGSGASQRSLESNKTRSRSSIWTLWGNNNSSNTNESQNSDSRAGLTSALVNSTRKLGDEKWHEALCESFIQEYMQYLQTLGFIPILKHSARKNVRPVPAKKDAESDRGRNLSGASFTSLVSSSSSQSGGSSHGPTSFGSYVRRSREDSGDKAVHYLQKSLPGGILLFEVGLSEPFLFVKLHVLEAPRIQKKDNRKHSHHSTFGFLDECDKIKVSMHLHSFTYDFHLRSIHSYLSGRQLIFKQGYHLTNFLDDFLKYYPKGPNFARNTVHIGNFRRENVSTPSHILFNYILGHEKLYKMKVVRMTLQHPESNEVVNEYILTQISSKKVSYKDMEDESQCDEFDLTLLIAHDIPPFAKPYSVDPSVLRLKYYIVLTSRRELYPKSETEEKGQGIHKNVNTPESLTRQKNIPPTALIKVGSSKPNSRRPSVSELADLTPGPPHLSLSSDKDTSQQDLRGRKPSAEKFLYEGIREEQVNYMGYFSSHEQMMQLIVDEQVQEVENDISKIVEQASVDCRRDLLWQRLLVGGQDEKNKNKKEDLNSRETIGALTYWEFSEMLELVQVRSLSEMDNRLTSLLRQPITFYQSLLKLLTIKHEQHHRYFVAPDKSTHQMAILSPTVQHSVVMLDINLEKHTADLSVVFKEQPIELEGEILNLIESVVNACCYCCWGELI